MNKALEPDDDQPAPVELPMNREERRKKKLRSELESHLNRSQVNERLRDTRSRASFVRRLGPR